MLYIYTWLAFSYASGYIIKEFIRMVRKCEDTKQMSSGDQLVEQDIRNVKVIGSSSPEQRIPNPPSTKELTSSAHVSTTDISSASSIKTAPSFCS
jgi:hypothetical protein